ncbi:hypothetical protein MASR2M74_11590 [Paracoccaceae bacterium]
MGSVGDSYGNALAETINGLFKAEVIHPRGPWHSLEAAQYAPLEWVDWFNDRRLIDPSGISHPQKPKQASAQLWKLKPWPRDQRQSPSGKPGAVHFARQSPSAVK